MSKSPPPPARRVKDGLIAAADAHNYFNRFKADLQTDFEIVEINLPLVLLTVELAEKHALRGYDAMQLTGGLTVYRALSAVATAFTFVFVSADDDLNRAAQAEGLTVENPNNHL